MYKTLADACVPRQSVFDSTSRDVVYNIDDLPQINAQSFFEENFVTEGMQTLLTEVFKRLEGRSQNSSGAFLLSQAMGGGKTHNLLALGLLAQNPRLRSQVMGDFYTPGTMGRVRVVTFSGRNTHTPYGIWGEIAHQLNHSEVFRAFYEPLMAPSDSAWVELLRGEPVLLMLDELPPYFEAMRARPVGGTTMDTLTTTAIANLLNAVASDKLPNACVVLTDLRASSYSSGSAAMNAALQNLSNEANRLVTRIDPVRLNSDELYAILRTRLFATIAPDAAIEEVALAYGQAVAESHAMDLTTMTDAQERAAVRHSYPFHYGIRDLFARFKENPSFQQTRALIRIMRKVVANLWQGEGARHKALIGVEDINLLDADIMSEIRQINNSLEAAIAHDIVAVGGDAVAQRIDDGGASDARDVATLIFLASLSQAVNPTLGLSRSELSGFLAAPGRNVAGLRAALDALQLQAWYLHATANGALLFKNTENLNAKLETYAQQTLADQREAELRKRLASMYDPHLKACYAQVQALPALDQVTLNPETVTLVIFRPSPRSQQDIEQFYAHQLYKNRVLFLTGDPGMYDRVLESSAYLRAIGQIIAEFQSQNMRDADPQLAEARVIETKQTANFYMACREAFRQLLYPSRDGLTDLAVEPQYMGNNFNGEEAIITALTDAYKYEKDASATAPEFAARIVAKLWQNAREIPWSDVRRSAATDPSWVWHHPRLLEETRVEMLRRDQWRDIGNGFVQRGPFPPPPPTVQVQFLAREDDTGEVSLRVTPLNGTAVYVTDPANPSARERVVTQPYKTRALRAQFIAENADGVTGEPYLWTATITIRHRFFGEPGDYQCELRAYPDCPIHYTTDGSSPGRSGKLYAAPFPVPAGTRIVLAQAGDAGVFSEVKTFDVPATAGPDGHRGGPGKIAEAAAPVEVWRVDPAKSATWRHELKVDATADVFTLLEQAKKYTADLAGVRVVAMAGEKWAEFSLDASLFVKAEVVLQQATFLRELVAGANLNMEVAALRFPDGQRLLDLVHDRRVTLQREEVQQP